MTTQQKLVLRHMDTKTLISRGVFSNDDLWGGDAYVVRKFGYNSAVGTSEEDIWSYGGLETLMTTAAALYISCTNNSATTQVFKLVGLDENWLPQTGYATLNGQTQAVFKDLQGNTLSWLRADSAYQVSAAPDANGSVYIAELDATISLGVPQDATKVHALIDIANDIHQTRKGLLTVPAGYEYHIYDWYANMAQITTGSARSCAVSLQLAGLALGASVASPSFYPHRRVSEIGVATTGPRGQREFSNEGPIVVPALTNISFKGVATATSAIRVECHGIMWRTG